MVLLYFYIAKGIFLVVVTSYTEFASRQALRREVLFLLNFFIARLNKCYLFLKNFPIKRGSMMMAQLWLLAIEVITILISYVLF